MEKVAICDFQWRDGWWAREGDNRLGAGIPRRLKGDEVAKTARLSVYENFAGGRLNSNAPSTEPCGTPYNNRCSLDSVPLYVTCCVRLVRNDVSHCRSSKMITGHIKTISRKTLFTAAVQALKTQAEKTTLFLFPLSPIFFIAPPPTHLLYIPTLPNMPPTISSP